MTTTSLKSFKSAITSLEDIYLRPASDDRILIDATIRRFKLAFEITCNYLKHHIQERGLTLNHSKEILQKAFQDKLIDGEHIWIKMLEDKTMIPNAYDEDLANEIYHNIKTYAPKLKKLLSKIESSQ